MSNNTRTPRNTNTDSQSNSHTDTIDRVDFPKQFKVILLNDDFTPMEFVILVLKKFFAKTDEQATQIMLSVHKQGKGLCGVSSLEIAEMKVMQVNQFAKMNQHPLKSILEEAT